MNDDRAELGQAPIGKLLVKMSVPATFAMALVSGTLILVLGLVFLEPLLNLPGASESLKNYARDYLSVILLVMTSNNLLRAEGKAEVSMMVMLIGAVTNIILGPIKWEWRMPHGPPLPVNSRLFSSLPDFS